MSSRPAGALCCAVQRGGRRAKVVFQERIRRRRPFTSRQNSPDDKRASPATFDLLPDATVVDRHNDNNDRYLWSVVPASRLIPDARPLPRHQIHEIRRWTTGSTADRFHAERERMVARTMMTRKSDSFHSYQKLVNVTTISVDVSAGRRKLLLFKQ